MAVVELSTILGASPERVWTEVNRPALLRHVARPLVTFDVVSPLAWPERWEERDYRVRVRLLGAVPLGWQTIRIRRPPPIGDVLFLRDDGASALVRRWDHLITVEPAGPGQTRYTDRIEIEAGALTPAVWAFARAFYAHRQRRWRAVVRAGFRYGGATAL